MVIPSIGDLIGFYSNDSPVYSRFIGLEGKYWLVIDGDLNRLVNPNCCFFIGKLSKNDSCIYI